MMSSFLVRAVGAVLLVCISSKVVYLTHYNRLEDYYENVPARRMEVELATSGSMDNRTLVAALKHIVNGSRKTDGTMETPKVNLGSNLSSSLRKKAQGTSNEDDGADDSPPVFDKKDEKWESGSGAESESESVKNTTMTDSTILAESSNISKPVAPEDSIIEDVADSGESEPLPNSSSAPMNNTITVVAATKRVNTTETNEISENEGAEEEKSNDESIEINVENSDIRDFEHHDGVVIATKVQGDQEYQINDVKQSMCLLTAAYNNRVNYDIIVFTSHPWEEEDVKELESIVAPVKVQVILDSPPVPEVVKNMSESGRQKLLNRCENVTEPDDFHWHTVCDDGKLRYNWQAEFRAKHIWTTPSLAQYKYMLWMDSDGHCGSKWHQDPVATMIRNKLVLLFDNFPAGTSRDGETRARMKAAFGDGHCGIGLEDGHLVTYDRDNCRLQQVHGFFHLTDLDFYRSPPVQKWADHLIGDDHFRRAFDDQIGITVPAAILAPNKSWDMYSHDIKLKVVHNFFFDGKRDQRARKYMTFWKNRAEAEFPEAIEACSAHIKSDGR